MSVNGISALERGDRRHPYAQTVALLATALGLGAEETADLAAAAARPRETPSADTAALAPPGNLTAALSSFVGREAEVAEIAALLDSERLVTLVGAGGIGKTRVSLRVAADLVPAHSDGVWFIELAPLANGDYLPAAVAGAMGFTLPPDDSIERLARALRVKRALLVFDNCEHVVESAARTAAAILKSCSDVRILATSRQALGVHGEVVYRLPSLAFPSAADALSTRAAQATRYASIALFVDRATMKDQRFALDDDTAPAVAEICRRLDGIPLAIELAATRVKMLDPRQLRDKLEERFRLLTGGSRNVLPRQQTLRALVDWSYDLLDERERRLFRALGIFVNGFAIEGAIAVGTTAGFDEFDVFDLIASLVDKSLVVIERAGDAARYRLLESTRIYAREKLDAAGEREAVAARHVQFLCARFAQAADRREHTARDSEIDALLAAELDDVRAALDWARGSEALRGGELLASIDTRWYFLGLQREGRERLEAFIGALSGGEPGLLSRLWCALASLADEEGMSARGYAAAGEAVALARASDDAAILAHALEVYARRAVFVKRLDDAAAALAEAEAVPGASPFLRRGLLTTRAFLSGPLGDAEAAARAWEQLRDESRALGNAVFERWATLQICEVEHERGNTLRAIALADDVLESARVSADRTFLFTFLALLASYFVAVDDMAAAAHAAREAIRHLAPYDPHSRYVAVAMEPLAVALASGNELGRAARLAGYSDVVLGPLEDAFDYTELTTHRRLTTLLRESAAADDLLAWRAEGASLTAETAIALALQEDTSSDARGAT